MLWISGPGAFIIGAEIIAVTTGFTTNHGVDNHIGGQITSGLLGVYTHLTPEKFAAV